MRIDSRGECFARAPRAPPEYILFYKEFFARAPRAPPEYIEFYKEFFARAARAPPQTIEFYTSFARARRARATPVAPRSAVPRHPALFPALFPKDGGGRTGVAP